MLRALKDRWFLVALAACLATGVLAHDWLRGPLDRVPLDAIVASVLLAMALSLDSGALWGSLRRPTGVILAIAVNLALLPLAAAAVRPLLAQDLADGLAIAAAVPCTMGSAAVLTRRAGGNDSIALVVTMLTNLACFLVTPAWIQALTGRAGGPRQSFAELVARLALVVLAPIVAGQLLRRVGAVGSWATRHRTPLGVFAQAGILSMVLAGAIECGDQLSRLSAGVAPLAGQLAAMALVVGGVHLSAWGAGYWLAGRCGLGPADRAAVGFAGSQKTLMVGLAIAVDFGGLAVLPMVAYHVEQLLIDTLLADRIRRRGKTSMTNDEAAITRRNDQTPMTNDQRQ